MKYMRNIIFSLICAGGCIGNIYTADSEEPISKERLLGELYLSRIDRDDEHHQFFLLYDKYCKLFPEKDVESIRDVKGIFEKHMHHLIKTKNTCEHKIKQTVIQRIEWGCLITSTCVGIAMGLCAIKTYSLALERPRAAYTGGFLIFGCIMSSAIAADSIFSAFEDYPAKLAKVKEIISKMDPLYKDICPDQELTLSEMCSLKQ